MEKLYMTRKEVAQQFGVTEATVGNWAAKGVLKRVDVTNKAHMFLSKASVENLHKQFVEIGACEKEVARYKKKLIEERGRCSKNISQIKHDYEFITMASGLLPLLQVAYGILSDGEDYDDKYCAIIYDCLMGTPVSVIENKHNVSRERIRQILANAHNVYGRGEELRTLRAKNKALEERNKELLSRLEKMGCVDGLEEESVDSMPLSLRTRRGLQRNGITNMAELIGCRVWELKNMRGIGKTSLQEIEWYVGKRELRFREE